jgi:phage FluMu protein Com
MSIEVHCDHCGRLLRASDEAAGKQAKCPACGQEVYVPTPHGQIEELELAPLDEADEKRREEIRRAEHELEEDLRKDTRPPRDVGGSSPRPRNLDPLAASTPGELERRVLLYLAAMVEHKLDEAETIAEELKAESSAAREAVDRLLGDEAAQRRFRNAPRPVIQGFLRQLRSRLK